MQTLQISASYTVQLTVYDTKMLLCMSLRHHQNGIAYAFLSLREQLHIYQAGMPGMPCCTNREDEPDAIRTEL